ncbi:MAG: PAS domain-containing protein [Stellaceae bacterium]
MLQIHQPSLGVRDARLTRLLADWEARRRGRAFPSRADFTPHDLKYLIGNLSLLDVVYAPLRFRYRIHATRLAQRVGVEMTGKWVDESPNPAHVAGATSHFTEVIDQRTPIVYRRVREFVTDNLPHNCEILALPLASDGHDHRHADERLRLGRRRQLSQLLDERIGKLSGTYILVSLATILLFSSVCCATAYSSGIGRYPTYMWARGGCWTGAPLNATAGRSMNDASCGGWILIRTPPFLNASWITTANASGDAATYVPKSGSSPTITWFTPRRTRRAPRVLKISAISFANVCASASCSCSMKMSSGIFPANSTIILPRSSAEICRHAVAFTTSASISFDLRRSSVWIPASFRPKITSPTIPRAITASPSATPHRSRHELYGGWTAAMINSAATAAATSPAHPHSHRPHDDDALSNWSSVAFIVPFGKRHAGKEFRGFWIGVAIGALIFALLFLVSLYK